MCKLCTILQFWTLQEVVREGEPVEVIFISFDQCPEDMMAYITRVEEAAAALENIELPVVRQMHNKQEALSSNLN